LKRRFLIFLIIFFAATISLSHGQDIAENSLWSAESPMTYIMSRKYATDKNVVMTLGRLLTNDDDVSVCLYLSQQTLVHPQNVMGMRRSGMSWKEVIKSLGFDATKLKKWQKNPSYQMDLTDDDVRDLVQLRFLVVNFGVTAIEVMRARNAGSSWTAMILSKGK